MADRASGSGETPYLAGTTGAGWVTGAAFGQQEAANTAVAAAIRASLTSFMVCFGWLVGWLITPRGADARQCSVHPCLLLDHPRREVKAKIAKIAGNREELLSDPDVAEPYSGVAMLALKADAPLGGKFGEGGAQPSGNLGAVGIFLGGGPLGHVHIRG